MNINDRVEEFKCELKMYNLHKNRKAEFEESIESIESEMATIKGICTDKIKYENISPEEVEKRLIALIDRKIRLEKEIDRRNNRIEYTDSILSLMNKEQLVRDFFFDDEMDYKKIALKHFIDERQVYREIDNAIKKALETENCQY